MCRVGVFVRRGPAEVVALATQTYLDVAVYLFVNTVPWGRAKNSWLSLWDCRVGTGLELVWCGLWQTAQVMATSKSFVSVFLYRLLIKASRKEPQWQRPQL